MAIIASSMVAQNAQDSLTGYHQCYDDTNKKIN